MARDSRWRSLYGLLLVCFTPTVVTAIAQTALPPAPHPVLHEPYRGTRVTESHTVLADGTKIDKESSAESARDSLGRMWSHRVTRRDDGTTQDNYDIYDPLTRTEVFWCSCNKVAFIKHFGDPLPVRQEPAVIPDETTAYLGSYQDGHRAYQVTQLPPQTILGLTTRGSRAVRQVKAGQEGNSKPLTTTIESWFSPELRIALITIVDDPVKGLTRYQFTQLDRSEPDPSLFVPPADRPQRPAPVH